MELQTENEYEISVDEMRVVWHRKTYAVKANSPQSAARKIRAFKEDGLYGDHVRETGELPAGFQNIGRTLSLREGQLLTDMRDSEGEPDNMDKEAYREYSDPKDLVL